ncbi:hypothetical protein [Luteimonas sp. SDU101]
MHAIRRLGMLAALFACSACAPPPDPPEEKLPEPQAAAPAEAAPT